MVKGSHLLVSKVNGIGVALGVKESWANLFRRQFERIQILRPFLLSRPKVKRESGKTLLEERTNYVVLGLQIGAGGIGKGAGGRSDKDAVCTRGR